MYVKRNYGFWMTFHWSIKPFLWGSLYASIIGVAHYFSPIDISIPWQPISVLGIAVAFYLGFKNNSSYDRTWEARKIWGGIVNHSRTFATAVITMVDDKDVQKRLIYRHVAWLTALRYQLRLSKPWEHVQERVKEKYVPNICEEYFSNLNPELEKYISKEEIKEVSAKANPAAQLLAIQMKEIDALQESHKMSEFKMIRMHEVIGFLYDEQGRSERIKNFPFPRQYASTAIWLNFVFAALIPFGMLDVFPHDSILRWGSIPFSALVIWVFFLMEKIGDYSENPFEGTYNDIPITSISRNIEIDIRQMINDTNIPEPIKDEDGFLM